jgi:hypothetical protein
MDKYYEIQTTAIFRYLKTSKKYLYVSYTFFAFDAELSKETSIFRYTLEQFRKQTHRQL